MSTGLPVSNIINVSVNLSPPVAQFPNFNTLLVLGDSNVIDVVQRIREYSTLAQVAADFGDSAPEYLAAQLWFSQSPQPENIYIGRWAQDDTAGQLICGTLSAANQLIAPWNAINTGSFELSVDGGAVSEITALNFAAAGNLNAVAGIIQTALDAEPLAVTCTYDAVYKRFVFTSDSAGAASTVSLLAPAGTGVDISGMLGGTAETGGYVADGLDAQTALATVQLFDNQFGGLWYGLVMPTINQDADHLAVAGYIEGASDPAHFYGVTSDDENILDAQDTTNIAYLIKEAGYNKTGVQYSSSSLYAICSALARILTTDWDANNSTITLMFKQEPGVTAETLTQTEMSALLGFNCNVFVNYNNDTAIIQPGIASGGQFIDSVIGCDWLRAQIQTNVYNLLFASPTKVPQTDAGMNQIAAQIEAALAQAASNGLLAPGVWSAGGFGQLKQGDYMPTGYYVYAPPIALQAAADRAARRSVPFQVAAKLGGAVHEVDVTVNVQN